MSEEKTGSQAENLRVFAESPADFFTDGFREIERTRMAGLPVLNPKVEVRPAGFRRWGNDWIGVMTTPWAILAVYVCGSREGWVDVPPGRSRLIELPAGDFPFVSMADPLLGRFLLLSLKSPVLDIADQETADAFAATCFDAMLKATSIPEDDEDATAWIPPTADGELRRVIPIRVSPPKGYEKTPVLTPKPPEPEKKEPVMERRVSRREFFGRGKRYVEKSAEAPKKQTLEAAKAGDDFVAAQKAAEAAQAAAQEAAKAAEAAPKAAPAAPAPSAAPAAAPAPKSNTPGTGRPL
ncbi:[NiFe]-hydrogenase assembly chaperone HybE [Sutterella sp.]|uniref:[NiFe]-hydrogenase assembly chaperone HybE n=1 Tax=Sutterella sp. TaxID=1981025 RepID=UPI0026DEA78D|nr:[NiFe]-hydrogenase assembly chaperone HybE [Sutterella sp.]MDO5530916.1 [NiFe]-hydrogenase assembly chaperone HybE [Sutterella sp.]